MHLTTLTLTSFRNHTQYDLRDLTPGFTAFIGPNGAGKTNILEGISLLAPGRGLRSADPKEISPRHPGRALREPGPSKILADEGPGSPLSGVRDDTSESPWSVHADITGRYGPQSLGVGLDATTNRRRVHVNGAAIKSGVAHGAYQAFTSVQASVCRCRHPGETPHRQRPAGPWGCARCG